MTTMRTEKPVRVQLSRAKGWRMPENTVKVDRTTKWGNPFIVGQHGDQAECARLFGALADGLFCVSLRNFGAQREYRANVLSCVHELRGQNLACWCKPGTPCHADVLLELANAPAEEPKP